MAEAKEILGHSGTSLSKVANHSARKTSISTLLNNDIHPLHVSQLSGHKNIDSLKSYHTASLKQQEKISNMLSSNDCGSSSTSSVAPIPNINPFSNNNINTTINKKRSFSQQSDIHSLYYGANISNCVFNISINHNNHNEINKRRRIIIESDDEE